LSASSRSCLFRCGWLAARSAVVLGPPVIAGRCRRYVDQRHVPRPGEWSAREPVARPRDVASNPSAVRGRAREVRSLAEVNRRSGLDAEPASTACSSVPRRSNAQGHHGDVRSRSIRCEPRRCWCVRVDSGGDSGYVTPVSSHARGDAQRSGLDVDSQ
jgi:hypothetical protein